MNFTNLVRLIALLAFLAEPTLAAEPSAVFGKWKEVSPYKDQYMLELHGSSVDFYSIKTAGAEPLIRANRAAIYENAGDNRVMVTLSDHSRLLIIVKSPTVIILYGGGALSAPEFNRVDD